MLPHCCVVRKQSAFLVRKACFQCKPSWLCISNWGNHKQFGWSHVHVVHVGRSIWPRKHCLARRTNKKVMKAVWSQKLRNAVPQPQCEVYQNSKTHSFHQFLFQKCFLPISKNCWHCADTPQWCSFSSHPQFLKSFLSCSKRIRPGRVCCAMDIETGTGTQNSAWCFWSLRLTWSMVGAQQHVTQPAMMQNNQLRKHVMPCRTSTVTCPWNAVVSTPVFCGRKKTAVLETKQ